MYLNVSVELCMPIKTILVKCDTRGVCGYIVFRNLWKNVYCFRLTITCYYMHTQF